MNKISKTVFGIAAIVVAFAITIQTTYAALSPSAGALIAAGSVYDDTRLATGPDYLAGLPGGTAMLITPGTDDTTLRPRINPYVSNRLTLIVNYPQAAGPIIAGKSGKPALLAPSYDKSKDIAIERNLAAIDQIGRDTTVPRLVTNGYSQGADALGDALERAVASGTIAIPKTSAVITSDPRGPWGLKAFFAQHPAVNPFGGLFGASLNGARNPSATGATEVYQVIVTGDPVANWQWNPLRPAASMEVNAAGFKYIHSDPSGYGDLSRYGSPTLYKSASGNTTYVVYRSLHPLTYARIDLNKQLGRTPTSSDIERWDRESEAYFPLSVPGVANAAVPVVPAQTSSAQPFVPTL